MPRRGSIGYFDDTEEPIYELTPSDNVYSYFIFVSPTEWKKEGTTCTKDVMMSYLLVALSFFAQGILIYAIFNDIVISNMDWQQSIMKIDGSRGALDLVGAAPAAGTCNDGGSLCFVDEGKYTCAPPTVQLTSRWDELDVDGDGIWTREEATKERERLRCKYAVDPLEIFDVFHKFLLKREDLIWLEPNVKEGKQISKAYFTYAKGDIVMCGYRNQDMCSNLLERDFFEVPLKNNNIPRVGNTIDSVLEYCRELLKPGGMCENILPSTYTVWKIEGRTQCGEPGYQKFTYLHPASGVEKSLLSVDYSNREDYEKCQTPLFMMYKGIIIGLWLLAMMVEFKQIVIIMTWIFRFPDAEQFGEDAVKEEPDPADPGEVKYIIQGINRSQRWLVGFITIGRCIMTILLSYVGVSFLSKQTDYFDLLMDGVGLAFVMEIAEILYAQSLRPDVRDQTESIEPMQVRMFGIDFLNRRPALVDIMCLAVVIGAAAGVLYNQVTTIVVPVHDSLECTCLSEGKACHEAQVFNKGFWDKYWSTDVPNVFEEVNRMKGSSSLFMNLEGAHALPADTKSFDMAGRGVHALAADTLKHHDTTQEEFDEWKEERELDEEDSSSTMSMLTSKSHHRRSVHADHHHAGRGHRRMLNHPAPKGAASLELRGEAAHTGHSAA